MNNRRKLVIAIGAGALTAPLASFAQQPGKVWRVGFLSQASRPTSLDSDKWGQCNFSMVPAFKWVKANVYATQITHQSR